MRRRCAPKPQQGSGEAAKRRAESCRNTPEYGGADTVNSRTLERARYAAWLVRQTGLPLLASGGPYGDSAPEAEFMKSMLEKEFATPVRWVEVESGNTFENARASGRILREAGMGKVYLVTHSGHMRRAVQHVADAIVDANLLFSLVSV